MTFSISARCARTGLFGIAVSSSSPAAAPSYRVPGDL